MEIYNKWLRMLMVLSLVMTGINTAWADNHDILTIGRATDKVSTEHARLEPIVRYLAGQLKEAGIVEGRVVLEGNNNNQGIVDLFNGGRLDIALESPFSAALYTRQCGAIPILLVRREGLVEYNSYVFVRTDSPIRQLEDLKGRTLAFEDPTSTSSYRLPERSLIRHHFLLSKVEPGQAVKDDRIGYVFAGSELNVSSWVFFGKVDAGCLSSADWTNPEENPHYYRESFRIIHKTEFIPRMYVMVRRDMPVSTRTRLQAEMLRMHQTPEGRDALKAYKIDRFVTLTPRADDLIRSIVTE